METNQQDRLADILAGREDNYLLPFYWQRGNHTDRIPEQIARIYESGCRAVCVESRTHEDFVGPGWWRDLDIILSECQKRDMKVWIFDDKHYPTGQCCGLIKSRPDLRQWALAERHHDIPGPMARATVLMTPGTDEEPLLGVFAYKRTGHDEDLTGDPIDLTSCCSNGFLYWDNVPDGCWRVFFVYRSHRGTRDFSFDPITEESVRFLIETVYEPHWEHCREHFGKTFAGFFSDEPPIGNGYFADHRAEYGYYDIRIGSDGLALPWNDRVREMMTDELGFDPLPYVGSLWYQGDRAPEMRLAYMNAVTKLFRDNFSRALGSWCRAHGVAYIGHIIEDNNAHARLAASGGHYFRSLDGQDMGGIDIACHQVMPGEAHYMTRFSCAVGAADSEFYHYVLGQLASSLSRVNPSMRDKAMCEVFGAYGWGEGSVTTHWLMDFLLVRGINRFIPHAFSPFYPNPDCPPHFGCEGHDPQFDAFSALMHASNKAAHLLTDGRAVRPAAILYHAEGEWMNPRGTAMLTQVPACALLDAHIAYDILPADVFTDQAFLREGNLNVNGCAYQVLVIPYAPLLPEFLIASLNKLTDAGFPVLYVDGLPAGAHGHTVNLKELAETVNALGINNIRVEGNCPLLRILHVRGENTQTFMFFNEDMTPAHAFVTLPASGNFARLRLTEDAAWREETPDGTVTVDLLPGQSEILVFGSAATESLPKRTVTTEERTLTPTYTIEIADADDLTAFKPYTVTDSLFDFNSPDRLPGFSGKMRYTFTLPLDAVPAGAVLDLGLVGENARVTVNGRDAGIRIAAPYTFPVESLLKPGDNTVTVTVSNTLAGKMRDRFSFHLTLQPSGLLGEVKLRYSIRELNP